MKISSSTSWPDPRASAFSASLLARVGRLLLLLTAISFMTMPVTERLWTWDHVLQGGRDFELSMILILSFLCLVLVLSRHGRRFFDLLFADWCTLGVMFSCPGLMGASFADRRPAPRHRRQSPALSMQLLPLQI